MMNFTDGEYEIGTYHINCIICNAFPGMPSCSSVKNTYYDFTNDIVNTFSAAQTFSSNQVFTREA